VCSTLEHREKTPEKVKLTGNLTQGTAYEFPVLVQFHQISHKGRLSFTYASITLDDEKLHMGET